MPPPKVSRGHQGRAEGSGQSKLREVQDQGTGSRAGAPLTCQRMRVGEHSACEWREEGEHGVAIGHRARARHARRVLWK